MRGGGGIKAEGVCQLVLLCVRTCTCLLGIHTWGGWQGGGGDGRVAGAWGPATCVPGHVGSSYAWHRR